MMEFVSEFRHEEEPFEMRLTEEGTGAFESAQFWRRPPPET
jgi:hypothetical protein